MVTETDFSSEELVALFEQTFFSTFNTRLVSGSSEPLYLPASNRCDHHRIVFAHGHFRSALHEIAHWCVAGKVRRNLVDYGYWYQPDGRSADEQRQFEQAERKPQALEWLFCRAAGHPFEVSCDNLAASDPDTVDVEAFTTQVEQQLQTYLCRGLPARAQQFVDALNAHYRPARALQSQVA